MRDMTLHKRAEEKMREARAVQKKCTANLSKRVAQRTRQLESSVEELRAKNEEIEAFVTIVSHDLSEKEVLLRELYHRVKNNLQVVQSLLKMGARSVRSSDAREAIETAVQRVHVMAMVHQRLYQMPDLMNLSLPAYLRDVIDGAIDSFCEQPDQVELQLQADEFPLSLDLAIPFGLLANELVSNCLKHGFPDGRQGKIRVSTQSIPGAMRFIVHDDGIGLPEHFNPAESSSMGLKLAASLAHQLGGSLEFTSRDGCRVQADLTRLCSQTQAHNSSVALHPQTVSDRQAGPPSQLGTFQSLSMNLPLPSL
jgi:two-component sensor histidine kinase